MKIKQFHKIFFLKLKVYFPIFSIITDQIQMMFSKCINWGLKIFKKYQIADL